MQSGRGYRITTYAVEQEVTQRVAEIIADIITPDMNDEAKVKAIHDWARF